MDKSIGSGHDSWYSQIYEKFRNERKHAKDPLVLQRKRKMVDQGNDIKLVKKSLRRGGINWEPAYPKGEDEVSMKAHVVFMKTELRKRNADLEKIQSRMSITFPHRRRFINEKKPLAEIKDEYPALFTSKEIVAEFERILAITSSIEDQFKANFSQMSSKIVTLAKVSHRVKCYDQIIKFLKLLESEPCEEDVQDLDDETSKIALLVAALLLQKSGENDLSSIIEFIPEDSNFQEAAARTNELHPKILVKGEIQEMNEKAVVAEKMVICTLQGMLVDAIVVYMAVNYVFMFEYPIGFNHFCLFLQKCVLHIYDGKKLPTSVLAFINKLDTLATLN